MEKIMQLKSEMFDLLRRREVLVTEVNSIQAIVQEKGQELEKLEKELVAH